MALNCCCTTSIYVAVQCPAFAIDAYAVSLFIYVMLFS